MKTTPLALALLLGSIFVAGCATNVESPTLIKRAAFAIDADESTLTIKESSQEGMRTNFTVASTNGKTYRCYVVGQPKLLQAMSLGGIGEASDAICSGVNTSGESVMKNSCNALLKAAGKC
jgi:hypothetical protein